MKQILCGNRNHVPFHVSLTGLKNVSRHNVSPQHHGQFPQQIQHAESQTSSKLACGSPVHVIGRCRSLQPGHQWRQRPRRGQIHRTLNEHQGAGQTGSEPFCYTPGRLCTSGATDTHFSCLFASSLVVQQAGPAMSPPASCLLECRRTCSCHQPRQQPIAAHAQIKGTT
jgi:hypothetical protein